MDFFNELGRKLGRATRSVQEWTLGSGETARFDQEIERRNALLTDLYRRLGEHCYQEKTGGGAIPEELIDEISGVLKEIDRLETMRDAVRSPERCPACGAALPEQSLYCFRCGRRLPEPDPEPLEVPTAAEYCPSCGAMREDEGRFCRVCQYDFQAKTADAAAAPVPAVEAAADSPEEPDDPVAE